MFKRNLVPYLIRACKQQHLIKLIVLLMFIVGFSKRIRPTTDSPRRLRYL